MRVLHFTNFPINIENIESRGRQLTTSGGWMAALLGQMRLTTDFVLACAAFGNVKTIEKSQGDRIECFVLPKQRQTHGLHTCRDLIAEWRPDLLHFHGTESPYGLLTARGMVKCPAIISLQGLLGPCSEWYHYFGDRNLRDILHMHRWLEFLLLRGHWIGFRRIRIWAAREREIIRGNHYFIGRTAWDRAHVIALNPQAKYIQGGELLREIFWQKQWDLNHVKRQSIIFTNAGHPRKGTETILHAASLLRHDFPDLKVFIAGAISHRNGYGRYIRRLIHDLEGITVELGPLNAEQLTTALLHSHVFVSPSYIDNSPNAVCEAQLLGLPVISTYTGGVPSLIDDGRTGLFFPTGDAPMLAARLKQVFQDDALAMRLGEAARDVARVRHNPELVMQQILSAYSSVI